MIKGRLFVTLSSKKHNNEFIKSFSGEIVQILHMAIEKYWIHSDEANRIQFMKIQGKEAARIECVGKCKFRLGVEQHVNIQEEDLK